jgi:hypothetical protein
MNPTVVAVLHRLAMTRTDSLPEWDNAPDISDHDRDLLRHRTTADIAAACDLMDLDKSLANGHT